MLHTTHRFVIFPRGVVDFLQDKDSRQTFHSLRYGVSRRRQLLSLKEQGTEKPIPFEQFSLILEGNMTTIIPRCSHPFSMISPIIVRRRTKMTSEDFPSQSDSPRPLSEKERRRGCRVLYRSKFESRADGWHRKFSTTPVQYYRYR